MKEKGRFGCNLYSADVSEAFQAYAEKRKSKDNEGKFLNNINNGQVAIRIENLEYLSMKAMQHMRNHCFKSDLGHALWCRFRSLFFLEHFLWGFLSDRPHFIVSAET